MVESEETFDVALSQPSQATLADGSGTGTILNDDSAVSLSVTVVALLDTKAGTLGLSLASSARADLLIRLVRGSATVTSWRREVAAGKSKLSLSAHAAKPGDLVRITATGRDGAVSAAQAAVAAG